MIASLDGYVADEQGNFDWAEPDEEVHAFVNDLTGSVGTELYGRRMYDLMKYWETALEGDDEQEVGRDFAALWQATDKVVYSRTLESVSTARTRLERAFDPDAVRELVLAADRDVTVSGPDLAGQAIAAGIVDEYQLFVVPVLVGGGTAVFPRHVRLDLELLDERRFANGTVYLRYRAGT
jgi:dihydrofolate reductase